MRTGRRTTIKARRLKEISTKLRSNSISSLRYLGAADWRDFVEGGATMPKLLLLLWQALSVSRPDDGAVVVCWTANDCLARPRNNRKI